MPVLSIESIEHGGQQFTFNLNHIFRPVNEAQFKIERVILCQVTAARVWFSAINVSGFVNPFECRDSVLLIKLRALRQIRNTVKIFQGKKVRSSLSAGCHDLRCDDFSKSLTCQILAKIFEQGGLNAKDIADGIAARGQRSILKQGFLSYRLNVRRRIEGKPIRSAVEHARADNIDFIACPRTAISSDTTVDFYRVIELEMQLLQ